MDLVAVPPILRTAQCDPNETCLAFHPGGACGPRFGCAFCAGPGTLFGGGAQHAASTSRRIWPRRIICRGRSGCPDRGRWRFLRDLPGFRASIGFPVYRDHGRLCRWIRPAQLAKRSQLEMGGCHRSWGHRFYPRRNPLPSWPSNCCFMFWREEFRHI